MKSLILAAGLLIALPSVSFAQSKSKASTEPQEKTKASAETQEKPKAPAESTKRLVTNFLKQLEPAALTAEQKEKAEEIFAKAAKEAVEKRSGAGIQATLVTQRTKVAKEVQESGKKGTEAKKAIAEKLGLTEEQAKALDASDQIVAKAKKEVGKLLSEEQLGKLDETVKASLLPKAPAKKKSAA